MVKFFTGYVESAHVKLEVYGIKLPLLSKGDDLPRLIAERFELQDGDVVVVTSKAISKVKGYVLKLDDVKPTLTSKALAKLVGKPPRIVEAELSISRGMLACIPIYELLKDRIEALTRDLNEARRLIGEDRSMLITVMPNGRLASDAGLDLSNMPSGMACYPPPDPDREALEIRRRLRELTGKDVAVVVTDTELSITKFGSIDVAIGCSGISPVERGFASKDLYGKGKYGGVDLVADELAACAALLMKQAAEGVPVVVVRGLKYERGEGMSEIVVSRRALVMALLKSLPYTIMTKLILAFRRRRPGSPRGSSG